MPYTYRGKYVDIRYTEKLVEIYYDHQRVASHPVFPAYVENRYRTEPSHMPDYFNEPEMNDARMLSWAATIGPYTNDVIASDYSGRSAHALKRVQRMGIAV